MEQLLSISTVPIKIEIKVNRAQLTPDNSLPKVNVTRTKGGFTMKAEPIKVNIDSFEVRHELGQKTPIRSIQEFGQKSIRLGYEGIAKIVQKGNLMAEGVPVAQLAGQGIGKSIETVLDFLPKSSPEISWTGGTLNLEYQVDDLDFDWDAFSRTTFEFVPGGVEFFIEQRPSIDIEYLGGPIYVPPSADPAHIGSEINKKA